MSEPLAAYQVLPDLVISDHTVIQTQQGIHTDIHQISPGNVGFGGFLSIHSGFADPALKVFRVGPMDHNKIERVNSMLTVFSEHVFAENAAYTHANIAPCAVVNATVTINSAPVVFKALLNRWYSKGNVLEHVKTYPAVDRITLLIETGKALEHLHAHDVVHGSIHPSNILVDDDDHVAIADVGIHTLMSQFIFLPSGGVPILPPAIYQPSEQLCPVMDMLVQPTTSMDVYAFATTAWAIFAGKEPFSDLPNFRTIERIVVEINLRAHQSLVKPRNMTPELWVILQRCLAADPARRPTMNEVVAELQRLASPYNH